MMKKKRVVHKLKTLPPFFQDILDNKKTFEIRYNDRDYKVGHYLLIQEYSSCEYTGRECMRKVSYVVSLDKLIGSNYVGMSIRPIEDLSVRVADFRPLYEAVNDMMGVLGAEGTIGTRNVEVAKVMNALYELDEGEYNSDKLFGSYESASSGLLGCITDLLDTIYKLHPYGETYRKTSNEGLEIRLKILGKQAFDPKHTLRRIIRARTLINKTA